jgi:hypothetical protein
MAKKISYGYKYKPTAARLFKPAKPAQDTNAYLQNQVSNLEKRFTGVGVDTTQPKTELDKRNLLEKALNLKPEQDVLMDILEVLDRPRQVVSNVLSSLGDKDKRNILEAAWEGLSGKERLSTKEALQKLTGDQDFLEFKEEGTNWDEVGNFIVDVGLDIASDPTTYLGFGLVTKPLKKVLKVGGSAAAKVGGSLLTAAKASAKLKPAAEAVEGFVKGLAKFGDDVGYWFNATKGLTDDQVRAIKQISAEAGQTAENLKIAIKDVSNILTESGIKNADRISQEIIENGAELVQDAATKAWSVVLPEGKIVLDDIVRQFYDDVIKIKPNAKTAGKIAEKLIPVNMNTLTSVAKASIDNFVQALNRLAGKELFKLRVGRKGFVALQFLGSADEFGAMFRQTIKDPDLLKIVKQTTIDIGKRTLTQETLNAIAKHGDTLKNATDKLRTIQGQTRKFLQQMGEFNVGGKQFESGIEYLRRVPTAEAEEIFKNSRYYVTDYIRPGHSDLAARTYEGTTGEINAALKDLYGATGDLFNESALLSIQDLVNVAQKQYTQTNLTKMFLGVDYDAASKTYTKVDGAPEFFISMEGKTIKEIQEQLPSGFKVIKSFKDEFSNLFKNLPPEMQKAFNDTFLATVNAAGDGTVAMQKSAYNILKNIDNAYKEVPDLIKFYDKAMAQWKGFTLLSPGFHGRNFFGNAGNMYLAGMNSADIIRFQAAAIKDLTKYKRLARLRAEIGEQALKQADKVFLNNFDEIAKSGVLTGHRGARDLEDVKAMIDRLGQGKNFKDKNVLQKLIETNFNLSEGMDDIQRIALYRWSLKKTGSSSAAFKQVREALFDYTLLTPVERNIMKRAIPFYTFMKNNLVFQAKNIVKNPQQYAKLLRSYKHWTEGMTDMDINELPDYMSGNMWLPIPTIINRDDKDAVNFLKLNLPVSDFAEFIQKPFNRGVTSLTVPAKIIIELGTGRDSFTDAPLKDFPGQVNRMEKGTGILSDIRGKDGEVYLSGDPVIQKIADDLGLRNPRRLVSSLLSIADLATGKQNIGDFADDLNSALGLTQTKKLSEIQLTNLYQRLEELRNLRSLYEQQSGERLPTLDDLKKRQGYQFKPK